MTKTKPAKRCSHPIAARSLYDTADGVRFQCAACLSKKVGPLTVAQAAKRARADADDVYRKRGELLSENDVTSVAAELAGVSYETMHAHQNKTGDNPYGEVPAKSRLRWNTVRKLIRENITFTDSCTDSERVYGNAVAMAVNMTQGDPEGDVAVNLRFIAHELEELADVLEEKGLAK